MTMMAALDGRSELYRQSSICRHLGSPFVGDILEAGRRQLAHAPLTEALIASWPGDRAAAAMGMRFNGALHALARRATPPALAALYRGEHQDYDGAVAAALRDYDGFIATWMRDPTQTNEVGRSAPILSALMVARERFGLPFELYELGTSCGLNLNMTLYAHDLGGVRAGDPESPVRIAPEWRGAPPPGGPVEVVGAWGADLHPLDANDPESCERLLAFIWADQHERAARLENALDLARRHPPRIERAEALQWINERLAVPQPRGVCRAVYHSMFKQYLSPAQQEALTEAITQTGRMATPDRPLVWISLEWTPVRNEVQLWLTMWPTEERQMLATCHPYGEWVRWL